MEKRAKKRETKQHLEKSRERNVCSRFEVTDKLNENGFGKLAIQDRLH